MNTSVADAETVKSTIGPDDFDWIVLRHQKQIYRTLLYLVRDTDAAEALTQECFLHAFRNHRGFRGESGLATWLVRIAINLAHDHSRNRRWAFWRRLTRTDNVEAIRAPSVQRSPEQALMYAESVEAVRSAVERLPERQKTAFMLRFVEDMPLEDIAEVMDLQTGTVKSHLSRALEAVRGACAKKRI
jgi:RNA polymerase sigma-70 factor (ECF subfamily)